MKCLELKTAKSFILVSGKDRLNKWANQKSPNFEVWLFLSLEPTIYYQKQKACYNLFLNLNCNTMKNEEKIILLEASIGIFALSMIGYSFIRKIK